MLFRSRDVYQVSIRSIDGDTKYVYEVGVDVEDKPYTLEDMDDGWTKLSYTFGEGVEADNFRVDFRVRTIVGDFIEIKNVFIGGQSISLSEANMDTETYGSVLPTFAETADHDWVTDSTYTVAFFTAKPHYEDDYPVMQAVIKGGKISTAELTNDGYYIDKIEVISDFHKDGEMVLAEFDPETSTIDADTNLLVTWKGVDRTVTFETNGGTPLAAKTVENGKPLALTNEEVTTRDLHLFSGWYSDSGLQTAFVPGVTTVTSDIKLYAKWILAANAKTVVIDLNTDGDDENILAEDLLANLVVEEGGTIAEAYRPSNIQILPGSYFDGWYAVGSDTPFDFTAEVNDNVVVRAKWTEPTTLYSVEAIRGGKGNTSADKVILSWLGDPGKLAKAGDIIAFKFRSTATIDQFSVRTSTKKFAYQRTMNSTNLLVYEVGDDGWISVAYQFPADGGSYDDGGGTISYGNDGLKFRFDLRSTGDVGGFLIGDLFEVKGVSFNGEELDIVALHDESVADDFDDDVALYAWPETVAVTFNYDNGGAADPRTGAVNVKYGERGFYALPEDTEKDSLLFDGWYKDSGFTEKFNSNVPIFTPTTLYGRWIEVYNVTLHNFDGSSNNRIDPVGKDVPMEEPRGISNIGYFLDGWFTKDPSDPEFNALTDAWDFDDDVTADMDLYAKWSAPTEAYLFTATVADERFQFRWHEDSGFFADGQIQKGDVFTLMIKFPDGNSSTEKKWRLRTRSAEAHITEDVNFSATPKEDGWYLITAVVPEGITGNGLYLQVYENANAAVGDKMIIKAFAYNGTAIEVDARPFGTASTSKGAYAKVKADGEVVNPDGTPIVP